MKQLPNYLNHIVIECIYLPDKNDTLIEYVSVIARRT
jgi:hypothetical protein